MAIATKTRETPDASLAGGFPEEVVANRLRPLLQQIADDSAVLSGDWNSLLDSLSVVSVLLSLEDVFEFDIPPENVVKKGGFGSVDEGIEYMTRQLKELWNANIAKKGSK